MAGEFSPMGMVGHREYIDNIYQNSFTRIKIGHPMEVQIAKLIPKQKENDKSDHVAQQPNTGILTTRISTEDVSTRY